MAQKFRPIACRSIAIRAVHPHSILDVFEHTLLQNVDCTLFYTLFFNFVRFSKSRKIFLKLCKTHLDHETMMSAKKAKSNKSSA
jgi:hypothetical protein